MEHITSAIIVDYKSAAKTEFYIRHAQSILPELRRFVVVDNSLDDANFNHLIAPWVTEAESVRELDFGGVHLGETVLRLTWVRWNQTELVFVQANGNLGFARGNNLGIRVDRHVLQSPRYLITNNDIEIHSPETLLRLHRVLDEHPEIVNAGPAIIGIDGEHQSPHRKVGLFQRWVYPHAFWFVNSLIWRFSRKAVHLLCSDILLQADPGPVYRLIGAFWLSDAERIHRVELFDPGTFLYAEELLLAERAKEHGLTMWYEPTIHVTHEQGLTTKNIFNLEKALRQKFKSESIYYEQYLHYSPLAMRIASLAMEFFVVTYLRPKMKKSGA